MNRPFVTLCIFLFMGILSAHVFEYLITLNIVFYMLILSLIIFLFTEKGFIIFILLTVSILGSYVYSQSIIGDRLIASAPKDVVINARILNEASFRNFYSEYEIEIIDLYLEKSNKRINVNQNSQLRIYKTSSNNSTFFIDDIIEIKNSNIRKLLEEITDVKSNSYEFFLKSKGIEHILEADIDNININNTSLYKSNKFRLKSYRIKTNIEDFLDSTLDYENSNIAKSIIFGNQGYLSDEKLDVFSKTGTAHIMAVSGLHVGLIVIIIDNALKLMKIGRNIRLYFIVLFLLFYGYIVYFPISIVRASLMYILHVIAYFLNRRYDSINALFFLAFILLIYNPLSIFSISFQLSFVATLSILILSPLLNKKMSKRLGFLAPLISVTLSAQIGTIPIMAYHFNQISIISLLTNLLIIPLLGPILFIILASVLFGLISFELSFVINQISNSLLSYINWISMKCAEIPYGSLEITEMKFVYMVWYYIFLSIVYFLFNIEDREKEPMKKYEL